jgi:protease-4
MSIDSIKKVASGRVWTGVQAKQHGLIDIIGNFQDAIDIAAKSAKVSDDYKVRFYPQYTPNFVEQVITQIEDEENSSTTMKQEMGAYYEVYQYWNQMKNYQGTQARMPYELEIQ